MVEIRKVAVRSIVRIFVAVHVFLYVLAGLIIAALYTLFHALYQGSILGTGASALTMLLIWLAGTLAVAIYAAIMGLLAGWVYNAVSAWWGGIRVHLVADGSFARQETKNRTYPTIPTSPISPTFPTKRPTPKPTVRKEKHSVPAPTKTIPNTVPPKDHDDDVTNGESS